MSKPAIQVVNLSKAYQIGQIGTGTISHDLERFFVTKVLCKEDPFLKIGETNDRSTKGSTNIVWSLKDINFEINQGDAVGIIGNSSAGIREAPYYGIPIINIGTRQQNRAIHADIINVD